jgi:hypothetical protein
MKKRISAALDMPFQSYQRPSMPYGDQGISTDTCTTQAGLGVGSLILPLSCTQLLPSQTQYLPGFCKLLTCWAWGGPSALSCKACDDFCISINVADILHIGDVLQIWLIEDALHILETQDVLHRHQDPDEARVCRIRLPVWG